MPSLFEPPSYTERPDADERLISTRVKIALAMSILKNANGTFTSVGYPSQDDIRAAVMFYQGGHVYVVSDAEAALLAAAGFGSGLSPYIVKDYFDVYNDVYSLPFSGSVYVVPVPSSAPFVALAFSPYLSSFSEVY